MNTRITNECCPARPAARKAATKSRNSVVANVPVWSLLLSSSKPQQCPPPPPQKKCSPGRSHHHLLVVLLFRHGTEGSGLGPSRPLGGQGGEQNPPGCQAQIRSTPARTHINTHTHTHARARSINSEFAHDHAPHSRGSPAVSIDSLSFGSPPYPRPES